MTEQNEAFEQSIGGQLKEAREAKGWSRADVAARLKITESRVDEIEQDRFDVLPPTFYKGYLRAYAKLMDMNPDGLLAAFNARTAPVDFVEPEMADSGATPISVDPNGRNFGTIIGGVALVLIIALAFWAWRGDIQGPTMEESLESVDKVRSDDDQAAMVSSTPTAEPAIDEAQPMDDEFEVESDRFTETDGSAATRPEPSSEISATGSSEPPPEQANRNSAAVADQNGQAASASDETQQSQAQSTPAVPRKPETESVSTEAPATDTDVNMQTSPEQAEDAATGGLVDLGEPESLDFVFNGDCYVEIRDATGEALAYGVKGEGKVMNLRGQAPFEVLLGDPSVVEMTYEGEPFDLSRFRAGRSVRLSVGE